MALQARNWVGLTGALLITACSQDGTSAAAPGLCPSCAAFGGETGDFSGGDAPLESCPSYDLVPADGAIVLDSGLRALAARQFVERDIALPAVWRDSDDRYQGAHQVGGFSQQTGLRAHIEVTGVSRLEAVASQIPWSEDTVGACDGLVLSVRVTVESEDGAIVGSFDNGRADVYSETEAQVRAVADVKQFTGSLQLAGGSGEHLVEQLELYLSGQEVRGHLTTSYAADGLSEDAPIRASDPFLELRASADDSCPIYAWPYDGAEGTSRAQDVMNALAATSPYRGFYDHRIVGGPAVRPPSTPEETEVSVELGAPTSVCQGRGRSEFGQRWSHQGISFDVPARLHTADGRYDLSVVLQAGGARADGKILGAGAWFTSDMLTSSQLRDRYGIDLTGSGADCASLNLSQSSADGGNFLSVWGGRCDRLDSGTSNWVEVLKLAQ
jgi:hypothetical protein